MEYNKAIMTSKDTSENITFIYDGSMSDGKVYKITKRLINNSYIRTMSLEAIDKTTLELGVKNPHEPAAEELKSPEEILDDIKAIDKEVAEILETIRL